MAIIRENNFLSKHKDDIFTQTTQKPFIGQEFLTWLWYSTETNYGLFQIKLDDGGIKKVQIGIDDRMVLVSKIGKSHEHIIKGGVPSTSDEAAMALRNGKFVKELKIWFEIDDVGIFSANLTGDVTTAKCIKLPEPSETESQDAVSQRIEFLNIFSRTMDEIFGKFMDERTDKLWETKGINSIRQWIQSRQHGAKTIN